MTAVELLTAALAVWQAVEVVNHSEAAAPVRAAAEATDALWARILRCPYCLSVWAGAAAAAALLLTPARPTGEFPAGWPVWDGIRFVAWNAAFLVRLGLYGLAVSRLANLANDVAYDAGRTPKHDQTA